jgi:hypothetical protein
MRDTAFWQARSKGRIKSETSRTQVNAAATYVFFIHAWSTYDQKNNANDRYIGLTNVYTVRPLQSDQKFGPVLL